MNLDIFKIFNKDKPLVVEPPKSVPPPIVAPITDTFEVDMNSLNGTHRIGRIRTSDYHRSSILNSDMNNQANFEIDVDISSLFPSFCSELGYGNNYLAYSVPNLISSSGKITSSRSELSGYESIIYRCRLNFSITKRYDYCYSVIFNNCMEITRTSSIKDNLTIERQLHIGQISMLPKQYQISDISQMKDTLSDISLYIHDSIVVNFEAESFELKKRELLEKTLSDFKKVINAESINDIFAHVIDALGTPQIRDDGMGYYIQFITHNNNGSLVLDKKMNDALYEITESVNRIKDCYDKLEVSIQITSGVLISIRPVIEKLEYNYDPRKSIMSMSIVDVESDEYMRERFSN